MACGLSRDPGTVLQAGRRREKKLSTICICRQNNGLGMAGIEDHLPDD